MKHILKDIAKQSNFFAPTADVEESKKMLDNITAHLFAGESVWCRPFTDEHIVYLIGSVHLREDGLITAKPKIPGDPEIMLNYIEVTAMELEPQRGTYQAVHWDMQPYNSAAFEDYREAFEDYRLEYDL